MTSIDFAEIEQQLGFDYAQDLFHHLCGRYKITIQHTSVNENGKRLACHPHFGDASLHISELAGGYLVEIRRLGEVKEELQEDNAHTAMVRGFSKLMYWMSMRTASVYLTESVKQGEWP